MVNQAKLQNFVFGLMQESDLGA